MSFFALVILSLMYFWEIQAEISDRQLKMLVQGCAPTEISVEDECMRTTEESGWVFHAAVNMPLGRAAPLHSASV